MSITRTAKDLVKEAAPGVVERRRQKSLRVFGRPLSIVLPHTLVNVLNLTMLQSLADRANFTGVPGDFVECGVYRGGTAGVLAHEALNHPSRRLWLFDAFAGMPAAGEQDDQRSHDIEGDYVGSEEQTRRILAEIGMPDSRVEMRVGWFDDTFPHADVGEIALLHVDCDFYDPVKLTLETFYPRVAEGGFVVLNDYGSYEGCRRATDEFLAAIDEEIVPVAIDLHAVYFQKPAPGGTWPSMPPIPEPDELRRLAVAAGRMS